MTERRRIYLLRHGEVSYFWGDHENPPLTEHGVEQARQIGVLLKDEPIDKVISSGMRRTNQTAELAVQGRDLKVEEVTGFTEVGTGTFEGVDGPEAMEQVIKRALHDAGKEGARFMTGNLFVDVRSRLHSAWDAHVADKNWQHSLVVAHGIANRVLLAHALGVGAEIYPRLEQDAGCINVIDLIEDGRDSQTEAHVRLINFTGLTPIKTGASEDHARDALGRIQRRLAPPIDSTSSALASALTVNSARKQSALFEIFRRCLVTRSTVSSVRAPRCLSINRSATAGTVNQLTRSRKLKLYKLEWFQNKRKRPIRVAFFYSDCSSSDRYAPLKYRSGS